MRLDEIDQELARLRSAGLLRVPDDELPRGQLRQMFGSAFLDLSSNDYLGLGRGGPGSVSRETGHEGRAPSGREWVVEEGRVSRETGERASGLVSRETGVGAPGLVSRETLTGGGPDSRGEVANGASGVSRETPGAGASRLVFGTHPSHLGVERRTAEWLGHPAALLFSSGYAANLGALGALLSEGDAVLSDELNHASLIDGIRLSRARATVVPHLDLRALEDELARAHAAPARWVVLESYYSMDGDGPDLAAVRALCDQYDASLYLDEAHGLGVFGPEGGGRAREAGVQADVLLAGFGKAVGSQGAAVLGSDAVRTWLWNRARAFVFSTAMSPLLAESLAAQIERTRAGEGARRQLHTAARQARRLLSQEGFDLGPNTFGPIVGVRIGAAERAVRWARALQERGILAQAIRPPTVPAGTSRLRLTLTSALTPRDLERVVSALVEIRQTEGARAPRPQMNEGGEESS